MTVLEPGCGMGYFTLPLARMVGETGQVIAIDIQPEMIAMTAKRCLKAGLFDRIEMRLGESDRLKIEDLSGTVDFTVAIHMVHETSNTGGFFKEVWKALKNEGRLLVIEPKGHVSLREFDKTIATAKEVGFIQNDNLPDFKRRKVLLQKVTG
jgi:ubiquinone/menaquinone biosynthesis C-methylase UbiE